MGNSSHSGTASNDKKTEVDSERNAKIYEQILRLLSNSCADDQFPLSVFRQGTDLATQHRIIELVSSTRKSGDLSSLLIKLFWNNRTSISHDEVTKLFRDCCAFDIKQALNNDGAKFDTTTLDSECFSALTNNIQPNPAVQIEQEQFYNWVREQFPRLFYGVELWLCNNTTVTKSSSASSEASVTKRSLMPMNNILNPTWVWLLTHQLPISYLSSDNTCTNPFERTTSVLHGRMWDHLYNSYQDGSGLNRFQHHVFGYKAPIIMLFELSDGYLFCVCCDEQFHESPKHFGGIQARLFQLKPVFKLILEGPNIIFMNTKLRGVSELGLFIGRDDSHRFLSIDGDFFNAKHLHGEGRLAAIDVWGTGGKASAEEQGSLRQWEDGQVEKNRKVKRSYEEEEAVLNMAGIETRHNQNQF